MNMACNIKKEYVKHAIFIDTVGGFISSNLNLLKIFLKLDIFIRFTRDMSHCHQ